MVARLEVSLQPDPNEKGAMRQELDDRCVHHEADDRAERMRTLRQTPSRPKNSRLVKVVGTSHHSTRSRAPHKGSRGPKHRPGRSLKG
jgi:hypothetical protein